MLRGWKHRVRWNLGDIFLPGRRRAEHRMSMTQLRREWRLLLAASLAFALGVGCDCHGEGEDYSAHVRSARCCSGLLSVSLDLIPMDDYAGSDAQYYPEGCGSARDVPPDMMVCIACGDGACGAAENFCNCPDDCPRE